MNFGILVGAGPENNPPREFPKLCKSFRRALKSLFTIQVNTWEMHFITDLGPSGSSWDLYQQLRGLRWVWGRSLSVLWKPRTRPAERQAWESIHRSPCTLWVAASDKPSRNLYIKGHAGTLKPILHPPRPIKHLVISLPLTTAHSSISVKRSPFTSSHF